MTRSPFGGVLQYRARQIAERRVAQLANRLAERIGAAVPGVSVQAGRNGVRLTGRGLRRRFATEAGLRWLGRLLR